MDAFLQNSEDYFKKLGFKKEEWTDKDSSSDKRDTLCFVDYSKNINEGLTTLQVTFKYNIEEDGSKKEDGYYVSFFGSELDIETNITTQKELEQFMEEVTHITRFFKSA